MKLLIASRDWNTLRSQLHQKKQEASKLLLMTQYSEFGYLPLYWACKQYAPYDIVETILKIALDSVVIPNKSGKLPLHCAVSSTHQLGVVLLMLHEYKGGAGVCDEEGKLPLHIACQTHAFEQSAISRRLIEIILSIYPGSVYVADIYGNLPRTYFGQQEIERQHITTTSDNSSQLMGILLNDFPEDKIGNKFTKASSGSFHWWTSVILIDRPEGAGKSCKTQLNVAI
jgi:hypothetical protein